MERFIIGVWQGVCRDGDLAANLDRTRLVIEEAAEAGCKIVCLPEQFLAGYGKAENLKAAAIGLDDERLLALADHAKQSGVVALVGLSEKIGERCGNTQVVLDGGRVAGFYRKTMLLRSDWKAQGFYDDDLPVFEAGGVRFGIIICHDSSFPEVAATMAWKGARVIFSPHFNAIQRQKMDRHRILVRNNHVGLAAHYGVVVARSNVVGYWGEEDRYGYGDSAIFSPIGQPIAEAGLFAETLVKADIAPYLSEHEWRKRSELRPAIIEQLAKAALQELAKKPPQEGPG
jgi:predicted amidohydrolase